VGGGTTPQRPLTGPPGVAPADIAGIAGIAGLAGLYGPNSEAWRLNREATLLLGAGPRAVLLQIAHPLVAEGVAAFSSFRADPWTRLAGTLRSYLRIVYGPTPVARAEIQRLNELHGSVAGPVLDPVAAAAFGASFEARDPALALWVHATLIDSTLVAIERWIGPLPVGQRARFYEETLAVGRLFGIPEAMLPPDHRAFDAYVAGMMAPSGPVHPSAMSRDLAATILHPPLATLATHGPIADLLGPAAPGVVRLLRRVPPAAVDWLLVPSVGLLPATQREEFGLTWGPRERAIDAWLVTAWRAWRPLLPTSFRWFPRALAADARMAAR
jgi:uncharacterized protein (DUF2236 family)